MKMKKEISPKVDDGTGCWLKDVEVCENGIQLIFKEVEYKNGYKISVNKAVSIIPWEIVFKYYKQEGLV